MRSRVLLAAIATVLTACGGNNQPITPPSPPAPPPVFTVKIEPDGFVLLTAPNETRQLVAHVIDSTGKEIGANVMWASSNPSIDVDATGKLTAKANVGSATVTAQYQGVKSAPLSVASARTTNSALLVEPGDILGITTTGPRSGTIRLTRNARTQGVTSGRVLVSTRTAPLLARVVSVQSEPDVITAIVEQGKVEEAYTALSVTATQPGSVLSTSGGTLRTASLKPCETEVGIPNELKVLELNVDLTDINVDFRFDAFKPDIRLVLNFNPKINFDVLKGTIKAGLGVEFTCTTQTLLGLEVPALVTPLGISVNMGGDFGVEWKLKASANYGELTGSLASLNPVMRSSVGVAFDPELRTVGGISFDCPSCGVFKGASTIAPDLKLDVEFDTFMYARGKAGIGFPFGSALTFDFAKVGPYANLAVNLDPATLWPGRKDLGVVAEAKLGMRGKLESSALDGFLELIDRLTSWSSKPNVKPSLDLFDKSVSFQKTPTVGKPSYPAGPVSVSSRVQVSAETTQFDPPQLVNVPGIPIERIEFWATTGKKLGEGSRVAGTSRYELTWTPQSTDVGTYKIVPIAYWKLPYTSFEFRSFSLEGANIEVRAGTTPPTPGPPPPPGPPPAPPSPPPPSPPPNPRWQVSPSTLTITGTSSQDAVGTLAITNKGPGIAIRITTSDARLGVNDNDWTFSQNETHNHTVVGRCPRGTSYTASAIITSLGGGDRVEVPVTVNCSSASPPTPKGKQIPKARSTMALHWDNGLRLSQDNPKDTNQLFEWVDHANGDKALRQPSRGVCLIFDDSRTQNKPATFETCNLADAKQQIIYDGGSYLGNVNGVDEWNIRPRAAPEWCLSTLDGTFNEGKQVVWQRDSCDQPERRWLLVDLQPPGTPPPATAGPVFVYPQNNQQLNLSGAYLFKVQPVAGASGYQWSFYQNGQLVWDNQRDDGQLSGTEYGIQPDSVAHTKFGAGFVEVRVRALVNALWTDTTTITIELR